MEPMDLYMFVLTKLLLPLRFSTKHLPVIKKLSSYNFNMRIESKDTVNSGTTAIEVAENKMGFDRSICSI